MSGGDAVNVSVDGDFDLDLDLNPAGARARKMANTATSPLPASRKRARSGPRSRSPATETSDGSEALTHNDQGSSSIQSSTSRSEKGCAVEVDIKALHQLSCQANELATRQHTHEDASMRLRTRLARSEQTYGELLRQSLQLQQSIEERRKQIKIEQQELEKEQAAAKLAGEQLRQILAEQHNLFKVKAREGVSSRAT
ncbi:hypothetical protein LTR05_006969 [Lithohypha guttulata]|uniref:Uncharacterized protein n=1 Tax=Lithohypha guttulata TaxID=1690604 RepID=A0AAN7SWB3_9EURO|nr:hypothetical protein LTR05_006969 [Lithohypha guttulata]